MHASIVFSLALLDISAFFFKFEEEAILCGRKIIIYNLDVSKQFHSLTLILIRKENVFRY